MNCGGKAALALTCFGLVGCAGGASGLKVRAIADPATKLLQGGDNIAVARGQLALNNVGLALEAFRKVQRDNPSDPDAFAGIADCYAAMGRFDLAQTNYEAALALAPHDRSLLLGIAAVFDHEGRPASAAEARAEANAAGGRPAGVAPPIAAAAAPQAMQQPVPAVGSITVALPPARPAKDRELDASAGVPTVRLANSLPADSPMPSPQAPRERLFAVDPAPRLERLSFGEVALVTTGKPIWRAPEPRFSPATALRSVAAASPPAGIQILNAARSKGLAASARTVLTGRGWRGIGIGDAPATQRTTVVLYPKGRAALGRSLAAQFGVSARMAQQDRIVLVLGRDSVGRIAGQRTT